MKNLTHYLFSLGLVNIFVLDVFGILLGLLGVILGRMLASVLH